MNPLKTPNVKWDRMFYFIIINYFYYIIISHGHMQRLTLPPCQHLTTRKTTLTFLPKHIQLSSRSHPLLCMTAGKQAQQFTIRWFNSHLFVWCVETYRRSLTERHVSKITNNQEGRGENLIIEIRVCNRSEPVTDLWPGQAVVEVVLHLIVLWKTQQVAVLHVHQILWLEI